MLFADVILPLALPRSYTYFVPPELESDVAKGKRVLVQFGKKKLYAAVVAALHGHAPQGYHAKYILEVVDDAPVVNDIQIRFWEWLSGYYLCTPGEVMNAALPAGFRLTSETRVKKVEAGGGERAGERERESERAGEGVIPGDDEYAVLHALEDGKSLGLHDIEELTGRRSAWRLVKAMLEKKLIAVEEEVQERYKPKLEICVCLQEDMKDEDRLRAVFGGLGRAPKQEEMLMAFLALADRSPKGRKALVRKKDLLTSTGAGPAALKTLTEKGVLREVQVETDRLRGGNEVEGEAAERKLTGGQSAALHALKEKLGEGRVTLFRGVTGSGKTEIYIRLIAGALEEGRQALYLLPEIALTAQIINRLRRRFGERVGVYHSRFNEHERVEAWNKVSSGRYGVVLGARSAVFLPFSRLGLVIVDEEHESSYKQYDPAPRYHARDAAVYLGGMHGARVLLGSATPSLESHHNAVTGKYASVDLAERYGGLQMPETVIADIAEAARKKQMKQSLSPELFAGIQEVLARKEQVILFQNRRGFVPVLECSSCAWVPHCEHCDVSLTYHKQAGRMHCHYCGYALPVPPACPACGDTDIRMVGLGTEKIEEEIGRLFPEARVKRMDLDSTRTRHSHGRIISAFEEGEIDILVGTQMVTKGLDFDHVALVGILNADNLLNFPDFRAFERSFHLLVQVAGRAGRKNRRGRVIVQTRQPAHHVIRFMQDNDCAAMAERELAERRQFHYPPYYRLVRLILRHRDADVVSFTAAHLAEELRRILGGSRITGPEFPPVARIRDRYQKYILLKLEKEVSLVKAKNLLREIMARFAAHADHKKVRVVADVDPY